MKRIKVSEITCFLSHVKPKAKKEPSKDEDLMKIMEEEIEKIEMNETWTLVNR